MLVFERKQAQPIVPELSQHWKQRAQDYLSNGDSFRQDYWHLSFITLISITSVMHKRKST